MKPMKRTLTLLTAILLAAALMTGCTKLTEAKDNTPSATDTPAETGDGVYVKLERDDVASLYIHGGSFSKVCENADGSPLKAGEWIYTGEDIVEISKKDNCSVVFTVGATAADDTLLAEGTFLYDAVQEKLYVTISADGVTCSTSNAADAPADVPPVLTLPVLDEIDTSVMVGVSGSSLSAVQAAVSLLNWGTDTGLGADEIGDATSTWLAAKNDGLTEFLQKLELVDDAVKSGAKLVMGGEVPEEFAKGAYMTPALLVDVTDDMRVSREEIFGPIIPMQPFKALDEAIEKANNTIYGLSSYFFGHNAKEIAKAFEGMEAGEIFINGSGGTEQTPHAGVKQSGVGCDKSPWSLEEYFDFKYCAMIP